jgi:hypothetical protein
MDEQFKQLYEKEEEFLDEFGASASAASELLNGAWRPNYGANDTTRNNIQYSLSIGAVKSLIFDSASVFHDRNGFSSVQIVLRSSKRVVNVRVRNVEGKLLAEKIIDKPAD